MITIIEKKKKEQNFSYSVKKWCKKFFNLRNLWEDYILIEFVHTLSQTLNVYIQVLSKLDFIIFIVSDFKRRCITNIIKFNLTIIFFCIALFTLNLYIIMIIFFKL